MSHTETAYTIRPIAPGDDAAMAAVIREVMPEFGAGGEGFAINDPEVDWMHRAYSAPRSAYFVVEVDGAVIGGGGGHHGLRFYGCRKKNGERGCLVHIGGLGPERRPLTRRVAPTLGSWPEGRLSPPEGEVRLAPDQPLLSRWQ